jgi:hypothetical protein
MTFTNPSPVSVEKEEIMRDANATVADSAVQGTDSLGPSSMVERVARALYEADQVAGGNAADSKYGIESYRYGWQLFVKDARAAIAALREPNMAMLEATWRQSGESVEMRRRHDVRAATHWRVMIDAALEPIGSQKRSDQQSESDISRAAPLSFPETKPHEQPTGWPEKRE